MLLFELISLKLGMLVRIIIFSGKLDCKFSSLLQELKNVFACIIMRLVFFLQNSEVFKKRCQLNN